MVVSKLSQHLVKFGGKVVMYLNREKILTVNLTLTLNTACFINPSLSPTCLVKKHTRDSGVEFGLWCDKKSISGGFKRYF